MKKILCMLLSAVMALSLAACGTSPAARPETTPEATHSAEVKVTETPAATEAPTEEPHETPAPTPEPVRPTEIPKENYPRVFAGENVFFILYPDGNLYGWGSNEYGQLGLGNTDDQNLPVHIAEGLTPIVVGETVLALGTSGTLWGWGRNDRAQLGLGDTEDRLSPVELMYHVTDALIDYSGVYALTEAGELFRWSWYSYYGELTDAEKAERSVPQLVSENVAQFGGNIYVTENGDLYRYFYNDNEGWKLMAENVKRTFGDYGMAFEDTDGRLWTFGENFEKILICESFRDCVLTGGDYQQNTYVLMEDGGLWVYNRAENRMELILDGIAEFYAGYYMDEDWGYDYKFALKENGELWAWSFLARSLIGRADDDGDDAPKCVATYVREVVTNGAVSYIIKWDGSVWATGESIETGFIHGALGTGSEERSFSFVKLGIQDAISITTTLGLEFIEYDDGTDSVKVCTRAYSVDADGRIWAWGWNGDGFLGVDSADTDVLVPTEVHITK